mgnify:CR=1 FL=1
MNLYQKLSDQDRVLLEETRIAVPHVIEDVISELQKIDYVSFMTLATAIWLNQYVIDDDEPLRVSKIYELFES